MAATLDPSDERGDRRRPDLLWYIAQGTAGTYGEEFFRRLVEHVARAFTAEFAWVAEVVPGDDAAATRARSLAGWDRGGLLEPEQYALAGTPGTLVAGGEEVVVLERGVIERFPEDDVIAGLGLDSCVVIALRGADGTHLGHLSVLASRELAPDATMLAALRIFAARAAGEVQRRRHEHELAASRERIVQAGDAARRRIERNLHDGAQQRLVALALQLRMVESHLGDAHPTASQALADASAELQAALGELRELARGIHPAVLSDRGLAVALEALATRAPLPVELFVEPVTDGVPDCPQTAEATAYYVVAEALTNVARYAGATRAGVTVTRAPDALRVEVADDGVGGATLSRGTGLRGLADRVEALRGTLTVESPPGAGTAVRATIPIA